MLAVQFQQQAANQQGGKRKEHHEGCHKHRPGKERHAARGSSPAPHLEDGDDDLNSGGNRADLGHAETEQPEIKRKPGRKLWSAQRHIGGPTGIGHGIKQRTAVKKQSAE